MAKINNKLMDSASKLITEEVVSKIQESIKYLNNSASKLISKEVNNRLGNSLSKFQNYTGNPELNRAIEKFTKKLALNKDFIVNYLKEHKDWKENLKAQYLLKEGKLSVIFQEKKIISADTPKEFLVFWLWYFEEYYGLNMGNFDKYKIKDYDFILYSEYRKIKMFTSKNSFEAMNDVYTYHDKNNLNNNNPINQAIIIESKKEIPAFLLKKTDDLAVFRFVLGELNIKSKINLDNSNISKKEYLTEIKLFTKKYSNVELNLKSVCKNAAKVKNDLEIYFEKGYFEDKIQMNKILNRVKKQSLIEYPDSIDILKNYFNKYGI
jgi:hypothetical protein